MIISFLCTKLLKMFSIIASVKKKIPSSTSGGVVPSHTAIPRSCCSSTSQVSDIWALFQFLRSGQHSSTRAFGLPWGLHSFFFLTGHVVSLESPNSSPSSKISSFRSKDTCSREWCSHVSINQAAPQPHSPTMLSLITLQSTALQCLRWFTKWGIAPVLLLSFSYNIQGLLWKLKHSRCAKQTKN